MLKIGSGRVFSLIFLLCIVILSYSTGVSGQELESEDIEFLGVELEELIIFITALLALALFVIAFVAYVRDGRSRLFYVMIGFLLFALKSFMLSLELFIDEIGLIEPLAVVLEFFALISFFYGVIKK